MGDRVDLMFADQSGDQRRIAEIADHQLGRRLDRPGEAGRQIVEHDDVFAGVDEAERHMAADVTRPAGHQNRHRLVAALAGPRPLLTKLGRSASHGLANRSPEAEYTSRDRLTTVSRAARARAAARA